MTKKIYERRSVSTKWSTIYRGSVKKLHLSPRHAQIIDLMQALKQSIANEAQRKGPTSAAQAKNGFVRFVIPLLVSLFFLGSFPLKKVRSARDGPF
jgi:hypothetical protein